MTGLYYDRLTRSLLAFPEQKHTLVGRWLLKPNISRDVFLNSIPVSDGDFLVPEASGKWTVLEPDGVQGHGAFTKSQLPDELEVESIRTLAERLNNLIIAKSTWLDWRAVVPLVPGMSDLVVLQPLDLKIRELLSHLEAVCLKPRAHLHVEIERVPVSMARRVAVTAPAYLASHTEDWDRPLLRGVLPKKILAEVRHDQFDIYENRVAARLVDHLSVHLSKRIREVRKLLKVFQDKEDYSNASGGTYLRRTRIFELWGQSIDANEGRRKAETTLKELTRFYHKLLGLMDAPLYREVPRRAFVATTLRITNILANDHHYNRVAVLWSEWADSSSDRPVSPCDVYRKAQGLCLGVDRFAVLLVLRALHSLGYRPSEQNIEVAIRPDCRVNLQGHGLSVEFIWEHDGTIRIQLPTSALRFVALASDLAGSTTEVPAKAVLRRVREDTAGLNDRLVILYLASDENAGHSLPNDLRRQLHTVGNDPRTGLPENLAILPVSPWEIGSVEMVARAVRWFLDTKRFLDYPISVVPPLDNFCDLGIKHEGWLRKSGTEQVVLCRPPKPYEWDQFAIEKRVADANREWAEADEEHGRISVELRRAVRTGKTGSLNKQKTAAQQRRGQAQTRADAIGKFKEDLFAAKLRTEALLKCPVCGDEADATHDFEPLDGSCFRCHCSQCKTSWGTRLCPSGHRYPVLRPGSTVDQADTAPGWEDRVYGSDILAIPDLTPNGEWKFVCPQCGAMS